MKKKTREGALPYSYLVDNIKVLLIFLVVFNHAIAFQMYRREMAFRYVWYAITIFHMPAFIFVSGYLSKRAQDVMKNVKNLLIPYILGYSLTWYATVWVGNSMDYEILRPSGTAMWYVLALFAYRLTIGALGKQRFAVPVGILVALWAGTRPEFSTYLSASRIVVFFPFFVAGYLWDSRYTEKIRRFKGKWVLIPFSAFLLFAIPNYMLSNGMAVDIFRGNHSYAVCGLTLETGVILRLLMYLVSFTMIFTLFALLPDRKLPWTFLGSNTMGIYFFHYPILIVLNGLLILRLPELLNVWGTLGLSLALVLVLGSPPVDFLYNRILDFITFLLFKKEKQVKDEGLEDEYDNEEEMRFEIRRRRRQAIEELASTLNASPEAQEEQAAGRELRSENELYSENRGLRSENELYSENRELRSENELYSESWGPRSENRLYSENQELHGNDL